MSKGYKIYCNQNNIGEVTSGTHSPTLSKGIGLAYINTPLHKSKQKICIKIRNKLVKAIIIQPPFLRNTSLYQ